MVSLLQVLQLKCFVHFLYPHACYVPVHVILLSLITLIIMELLIIQFSSSSCYFPALIPMYFLEHPVLKHLQYRDINHYVPKNLTYQV